MSGAQEQKVPLRDESQQAYLSRALATASSAVLERREKEGAGKDKVEMLAQSFKDLSERISKKLTENTYIR